MATAVFTFEVYPGRNILDYNFSVCQEIGPDQKYAVYQYVKKGSAILNVDYVEKTLPGSREIKNSRPRIAAMGRGKIF